MSIEQQANMLLRPNSQHSCVRMLVQEHIFHLSDVTVGAKVT